MMFRGSVQIVAAVIMVSVSLFIWDPSAGEVSTGEYHSSNEIASIMEGIARDHASVMEYHTASDLLGTRDIPGDRIIPVLMTNDHDEERPWVMLIGGHHGDEPDSSEAVVHFADHLTDSYSAGNERARWIVENTNLAILPVVNPYGLDMGTRVDENGEDPNRDYPFQPSAVTSTTDGIPLTTAGAHAVHTLAGMFPFSVALSFHTGSKGIYHSWGAPDVGTLTPDSICFNRIGRELSNASGHGLEYGPANEFPYVADLRGAFDDHLYGSSFMPDHLYSPSMQLPWSAFAATVELDTLKGQNTGNLGSLQGLWDHPVEDQGTVPLGVRVCYAACEMAGPGLDVDHVFEDGNLSLSGIVRGALSMDDMEISVDGIPVDTHVDWIDDPLLPELGFSTIIGIEAEPGNHQIAIELDVDGDWTFMDDQADPAISPQSVIARSREDKILSWAGFFDVESEPPIKKEDEKPVVEISHNEIVKIDEVSGLSIDISFFDNDPSSMEIILEKDGLNYVSSIPGNEVRNGTHTYSLPSISLAGDYDVIVNLTYDDGFVIDRGTYRVVPTVFVTAVHPYSSIESKIPEGLFFADGVDGTIPVYWGVSRTEDEPWDGDGWILGPGVVFPENNLLTEVPLDLTNMGGQMFFRVSPMIDDGMTDHDSSYPFRPSGGVDIISSDPVYSEGEVILGPIVILSRIDGLEDLNMVNTDMAVNVTIFPMEGASFEMHLEWMHHQEMNENQTDRLSRLLYENGILSDEVRGAFFANTTALLEQGNHSVIIRVSGNLTDRFSRIHPFYQRSNLWLPVEEGDEINRGEERKWMSWQLIIFLVVVALMILLVSFIRYDAHVKDPEPDEDDDDGAPSVLRRRAPDPANRGRGPSARKVLKKDRDRLKIQ